MNHMKNQMLVHFYQNKMVLKLERNGYAFNAFTN